MTKLKVEVAQDHLERICRCSSVQALAELIWNALDGDSKTIHIELVENKLRGLDAISVRDDGHGISYELALKAFKSLGNSWKKTTRSSPEGRLLHGKAGEGRFAAFGLGNRVQWKTYWKEDNTIQRFQIVGNVGSLCEFDVSAPTETEERRSLPILGTTTGFG